MFNKRFTLAAVAAALAAVGAQGQVPRYAHVQKTDQ